MIPGSGRMLPPHSALEQMSAGMTRTSCPVAIAVDPAAAGPRGEVDREGAPRYAPGMARPRRIYKLKWRSKKANHGRKPTRGRNKKWR